MSSYSSSISHLSSCWDQWWGYLASYGEISIHHPLVVGEEGGDSFLEVVLGTEGVVVVCRMEVVGRSEEWGGALSVARLRQSLLAKVDHLTAASTLQAVVMEVWETSLAFTTF